MQIGTYISVITLNVNGVNTPKKGHRLVKWTHTKRLIYFSVTRHPLQTQRHKQTESERMGKDISCK